MRIYNGINELVGNTKLVYLKNYCEKHRVNAKICLKLESSNPTGSVKDRAALYMIKDAEAKGLLKKGATIIEPTSGNTGIGLAAIGRARGYKVILTMPDTMSVERIKLLKAYGAEVILTDGKLGMKSAIDKAIELNSKIEGSVIPGQFDNPANALAHYETTGPEIWNDTDGEIKAFVAGVGTGATLSGTGKFLKEKNSEIIVAAVEPASSPMISEGKSAPHKLQGIGANFVPDNFKAEFCDEIITVSNEEAYETGREVANLEGMLIGISSGAALCGARKLVNKRNFDGQIVVAVAADSGEHYLSVPDYILMEN
ncbi:MAG: cysteine synthase A [Clostridia bacterium]|nr:cysteine synthase A [Clostridia bacterium]